MACAGLLLASMLAAITPTIPDAARSDAQATAQGSSALHEEPTKPIDLSIVGAIHDPAITPPGLGATTADPDTNRWSRSDASPGITLGPLRTQFGGVTGRHMQLATMKLQGVSLFGASVGGSVSSRSAQIIFSWPSTP